MIILIDSFLPFSLNNFKFREALKNLMNIARLGNKYLADSEPWKIKNDYPERVEEILNVSFIIVSYLAILSEYKTTLSALYKSTTNPNNKISIFKII